MRRIDRATLDNWLGESATRATYLLDVRTPDEYAAGHLPGSVSAEGGQLVQAVDRWVGIRGARLVLVDDTGTRAIMTAHWLKQMGWDAVVLDRAFDGQNLETGTAEKRPSMADVPVIGAAEAAHWINEGDAAAVAIMPSGEYRQGHPEGAVWAIRPRLDRLPDAVLRARRIVVLADDPAVGALAAFDLAEIVKGAVALVQGGVAGWRAAGHLLRRLARRSARCRADRLHLLESRPPRRQPGSDAGLSALGDGVARRSRAGRPRRVPACRRIGETGAVRSL